ncbi:hypothetical protein JYB64_03250 [Algoriphagus aestuarii]|nr:hypothetical protein [Algoriphagus aestuarii]
MTTSSLFIALCGVGWIVAYVEALRIGLKDKTYAIPFLTLALNFTWEIYYTIQGYHEFGYHVSTYVNFLWVLIDIGILYTYFRFGRKEVKGSDMQFYIQAFIFILSCFFIHHYTFQWLGIVKGALYSGFSINFVMSFLFIRLFYRRGGASGQSLIIAISKCFGTFSSTVLIGMIGSKTAGGVNKYILFLGLMIFVVDLFYIYLLAKEKKASPKKPIAIKD